MRFFEKGSIFQIGFGVVGKSASTAGRAKMIIAIAIAVTMRRFHRIDGHAADRIDGIEKQGLIHDAEPSNVKPANAKLCKYGAP
jgi:hypothetical protein